MSTQIHTLQTLSLRKEYPGTVALNDVTVSFAGGQIHALIGKNGAGKSTLVKLIAGATRPTRGSILVDGKEVSLQSPRDALQRGIVAVHQELSLVPELSVGENILLGRLPKKSGFGASMVDWKRVQSRAEEILVGLGVALDVNAHAGTLGVAQQQSVEIAKAMSYEPSILILDEPTSALAQQETERLFELLRSLKKRGVVLLYITHRLQELREIADTITALRNGSLVGTIGIAEATPSTIVHMMFGEVVQRVKPADLVPRTEPFVQVRSLSRRGAFENINFTLHKGEILGIAGLLGSGRTELLRALFGADPADAGDLLIDGRSIRPSNPRQMKDLGVVLTPENRKDQGLVQILNTRINACLASLNRISSHGFLTRAREQVSVERNIRELDIAVADPEAPIAFLSGGNQQKVVIGKWLNTQPRLVLLDEPTRGIDVQAKQQMFQIIWDMSKRGISCIVVSSELEELLDICHRILIMRQGEIVSSVRPDEISLENLFAACMKEEA
ncbi:MAG: sugar ABC transporter ATP-binding protein [Ignavibacteriales bacterium]|nr:sugar ABC transporter ATP-binding protein [Ignavibacteriales bacterium]